MGQHWPGGTKPLPEPMLTYHPGGPVTITLRTISLEIHQPSITKITLKITYLEFQWNIPGTNELKYPRPLYGGRRNSTSNLMIDYINYALYEVKINRFIAGKWYMHPYINLHMDSIYWSVIQIVKPQWYTCFKFWILHNYWRNIHFSQHEIKWLLDCCCSQRRFVMVWKDNSKKYT